MMRVFVAGATGAIGRRLVPRLVVADALDPAPVAEWLPATSNAKAERELAWRPAHPSWRPGLAAA